MRPILFTLIVALSFFVRSPQLDLAQADFLGSCNHAAGSSIYRPDGVVIRYEYRNARLLLISMTSGEIAQVLEESFSTTDLANLDWSPDCRTLYGTANGDAILWDVVNGGRVATFSSVTPKHTPYWNPARPNLILETRGGSYLWNYTQGTPMLLDYDGEVCHMRLYRFFSGWQVEWDNARNQVLVVPNFVEGNVVIAYDQTSAQQVAAFDNACLGGPLRFNITPDGRHVLVFTSENDSYVHFDKAITVWDRDTMEHVSVDANAQSAVLPTQVALSPDGRYLVLARIGTMRVWDLTDLAEDVQQRDPIHRHRIDPNTLQVRFVSDTLVETTDFKGHTVQWDVLTGERGE
ncbi:MAG: WD40 repeat domain-containing protein [Anaerolineae bacterium]|nr:WD40 repeat domain-containing protein [Anaerolineae bacterium]